MKKMGHEKPRSTIIAISARDVAREHSECASELTRPRERVRLSPRYYIVLSSASFRLFRDRTSTLRVFFLKRQPEDRQWRTHLRTLLRDRIGLVPRLGSLHATGDNYHEFIIDSPAFWFHVLQQRIAAFLD